MAARQRQLRELEASCEVARVFYEAREVLRVTGVDAALRAWAVHERFLVALWARVVPNLETRAFEEAGDAVREEALAAAWALGPLGAWAPVRLGESQRYHARGAVELYHYLAPKLLVLASAVRLALADEPVGQGVVAGSAERIERGAPRRMLAMECMPRPAADARVRAVWEDVERTLGPPGLPGEWRALAMWPELLEALWGKLKPRVESEDFTRAADALRLSSRRLARRLPYSLRLSREWLDGLLEDTAAVFRVTESLEQRLPLRVLALALVASDAPDVDKRPFPAPARLEPDWAAVGELT